MRTATSGVGLSIAAAAAVVLSASAWCAESAVWTPRALNFVYMGVTAQYSCDGLRDRVTDILLKLGARRDLEVHESPCVSIGQPDAFPGVKVKMSVLLPAAGPAGAAAQGAAAAPAAVPAHWKRVDLTSTRDPGAGGDCELLDQVREEILPLFATRNVEFGSSCQPHQVQLGAYLRAEVLVPDEESVAELSMGSPAPAPDR